VRARLPAVQANKTILYDSAFPGPKPTRGKYSAKWAAFDSDLTVAVLAAWQPNDPQAGCHWITPITKVKERCPGYFLGVLRAVSRASWPCKQRPIPHRLAGIPGTPSATTIAWAIRSFASRHVGHLARADVPPTGRAGRMSGPASLPSGNHALSGRKTVLATTIRAAALELQIFRGQVQRNGADLAWSQILFSKAVRRYY
jgi:hypothetical protein